MPDQCPQDAFNVYFVQGLTAIIILAYMGGTVPWRALPACSLSLTTEGRLGHFLTLTQRRKSPLGAPEALTPLPGKVNFPVRNGFTFPFCGLSK